MSAPSTPDSDAQFLRTALVVLAALVGLLCALFVLGLCGALAYIAWQHPGAGTPLALAVSALGAVGTVIGTVFTGAALWHRRP